MSFGIALSGLDAAQSDLDIVSNNIANSSTTGFKASAGNFADIFATSNAGVASLEIGEGVQLAQVQQQFTQGNIRTTGGSLDMAISGQGFFTVKSSGSLEYTRAGSFGTDNAGYVVNPQGARLQVFPSLGNGTFNTSTLQDLQLQTSNSAPLATTTVQMVVNLPSDAKAPATSTFSASDPTSYTNTTTATVYDSLGAAHTSSIYFVKGATANAWTANLTIDGSPVGTAQAMTYSTGGALVTPTTGVLNFGAYTPTTGANALNMNFNLGKSTQYGSTFAVNSVFQNGYTSGMLTGISVGADGVVQANFTNGQSVSLGQIAMANFADPNGLQQLGNTSWAQTAASGQALMGPANSAGFGSVQSGGLEQSNVDVTAQLVRMITAQRAFQANAQMITTQNAITQTVINIRNG